jgi:catechol 2,3-dioxygenase-like lactoylglutathione lyase family enzyme
MRMRVLLLCFVLMWVLQGVSYGQLPEFYSSVNRVTWIVPNVDAILPSWIALGMTDVHKYEDLTGVGTDHGKPATLHTHQVIGRLGNLTVNFVQPGEREPSSYRDFLEKHKDGIFSVVHEVPTREEMDKEIKRMAALGVGVLQQMTFEIEGKPVTYTYFDTEPQGKYVLGLVYWPGGAPKPLEQKMVSHIAPVARDAAAAREY